MVIEGAVLIIDAAGNVAQLDGSGNVKIVGTVDINTLPNVTITAMPSVVIGSMPNVDINSLPVLNINDITGTVSLPTGAATETKQDSVITNLQTNNTDIKAKQDLLKTTLDTLDASVKAQQPRAIEDPVTPANKMSVNADGSINTTQASGNTSDFRLKDATDAYYAKVDDSGNQYVITPTPAAPEGTTAISDTQISYMSGEEDSFTVIPNGEDLTIQRFKAGCEIDTGGSKVELYYAPNGNTTGMILIEVLFLNGSSGFADLTYNPPTGDGTAAIMLKRERLGGGSSEIFGKWEGYY